MVVLQVLQQPLLITLAILRQHIVTSTANLGVAQPLQLTILVIATLNSAVTIPIQPFGLGNNSQSRPASSKPGLLENIWYSIQLCHEVHDMTGWWYFCIVDDCQFTSTWIPLRVHYTLHVFSWGFSLEITERPVCACIIVVLESTIIVWLT